MSVDHICLGVQGLPERVARLDSGEMYAIACSDLSIREVLIAGALLCTLDSGRPAVLISAAEPSSFLAKAARAGFDLKRFVQRRRLQLLRQPQQAGEHLQKVGAKRFIDELDRAELAPGSLILFDQADPIYLLGDPPHAAAAMRIYAAWTRASGHTILSVFDALNQAPRQFVTLTSLASAWSGFAQISLINQRLLLDVRHWTCGAKSIPRECFEVRIHRRGKRDAISLRTEPLTDNKGSACLSAENTVIAMRQTFDASMQVVMPDWRWLESHENVLEVVKAHAVLTVVLQFCEPSEYEQLCSDVVALRKLGNSALRIVVRERQVRLRMPMAMALYRIGVSSIIPAQVSDSSALLQIEALQGTRIHRSCDSNIVRVQRELKAILESDLKDTVQFRLAVEYLLAQSESYKLEHTLVRLYLKPGQQKLAVEFLTREGRDLLIAVDGSTIWLFLFACARIEVRGTLDRVFASSLNELFNDRTIVNEPPRMLAALESIRLPRPEAGGDSLDYRRVLAEV